MRKASNRRNMHFQEERRHRKKLRKQRVRAESKKLVAKSFMSDNPRPLFSPIKHTQLIETSKQLGEILRYAREDTNDGLLEVGAPDYAIVPSLKPNENELHSLPLLWLLIGGLDLGGGRLVDRLPIVELRAAIPSFTKLLYQVLDDGDEDAAVNLVDLLNLVALQQNNAMFSDMADLVLYEVAVVKEWDACFPQLVRRMRGLFRQRGALADTVAHAAQRCADARLKLMMLQKPADLRGYNLGILSYSLDAPGSLRAELQEVLNHAEATPLKCVRLWLNAQIEVVMQDYPNLKDAWAEAFELSGEELIHKLMVPYKERRSPSDPQASLADIARDVSRLHQLWIGKHEPEIVDSTQLDDADVSKKLPFKLYDLHYPRPAPKKPTPKQTKPTKATKEEKTMSPEAVSGSHLIVVPQRSDPDKKNDRHDDTTKEIRKKLEGKLLQLLPTPDLSMAREHLVTMLPHLSRVIDRILNAMVPHPFIKIPPVLLVGRPGCGKTTLLEELVQTLPVPFTTFDAAGHADAQFLGTDKRWGNSAAGIHLELLAEHQIANPVFIIDELEKLGGSTRNGDPRTKLLSFLEPRRAKTVFDTFLSTSIDTSAMSWVFTANSLKNIPAPLQNRLEIIQCPSPKREHLELLAPQLLAKIYKDRSLQSAWCEPLTPFELDTLRRNWAGGSIRNLRRLMQAVVDSREKFMPSA